MSAPDPRELGPLEKAVNDAAGRASVTWISFLSLATYLAIATGSITHRDLFLEEPVTLPVLNVKLPLLGFFVVAPLFFLVSHFYALLQLQGLMAKAADYTRLLHEVAPNDGVERHLLRQRLDSFLFLQLMAYARGRQPDLVGRLYRLVAWITMVGAPVAVLLLVQVTFLPYHHEGITWLHRLVILTDVAVIWLLWPRVRLPRSSPAGTGDDAAGKNEEAQRRHSAWSYVAAIAVLLFAWLVARFPGESIYPEQESLTHWLFEGAVDQVRGRPAGWLSNRLVLPDQDFIDDEKLIKHNALAPDQPFLSMRGRNLRKAVLLRADLRQADFSGTDLQGANLSGARLNRARFVQTGIFDQEYISNSAANLEGASLEGADLTEAKLSHVIAREAGFESAKLVLAELSLAKLEGANFRGAFITSANLAHANLQGSFWFATQAQDAQLRWASLTGATMWSTNLQGADLTGADLRGVMFKDAHLQGASLIDADISAAQFLRTQLQGADLSVRAARAAAFCRAYVFRAATDNYQGRAKPAPGSLGIISRARFSATRITRALRVNSQSEARELSAQQYQRFVDELIRVLPRGVGAKPLTPIINANTGQVIPHQTASPRERMRERLQRLSPYFRSPARDELDRGRWTRLERKTASADLYVVELGELLSDIACTAEDPYVARGIVWSDVLRTSGPASAAVAARLRDPRSCPGAWRLDSIVTNWFYSDDLARALKNPLRAHCGEKLAFPDPWPPKEAK